MNLDLYRIRCRCKTKKPKLTNRSEGKLLPYPSLIEITDKTKTFQIKYEKNLSSIAKVVLNSFQYKYLYYAIDDILYLLKANPIERDNLLEILYAPVISIQNNFSVNFFDIWIYQISINEVSKVNKFLTDNSKNSGQFSYITIQLWYQTRIPPKKPEPLW